ncbi:alsin [Chanos chanos]|uniref:Alsin n=1 Tax=Chanos chanos TaxID=29144 RepID=A0A6J2WFH3_CHACN|nr:alsin-like [Chanos chanos]
MEEQLSSAEREEDGCGERGVLHRWQGYSCKLNPERLLLPRPVLQAALGTCHGLLLTEEGQVYSFGELPWKQGLRSPPANPILESSLSSQCVLSIAAGSFHCGAVTDDGHVHMWGENSHGQCGIQGLRLIPNPTLVSLVDAETMPSQQVRVMSLACGAQHTLALSVQREVWAWGSGCQLGLVTTVFPVWNPQKVEHLAGRYVVQIACGGFHSMALVRCLPPSDSRQHSLDKCGQCKQVLYTMIDEDDHVIISDNHYCPLGVALSDAKGQGQVPRSGQTSKEGSPAQTPKSSCSDPNLLTSVSEDFGPSFRSSDERTFQTNPEVQKEPEGNEPAPVRLTDSPKFPLKREKSINSSLYPDEQELKNYLKKMSDLALSEHTPSTEVPCPPRSQLSSECPFKSDGTALPSLPMGPTLLITSDFEESLASSGSPETPINNTGSVTGIQRAEPKGKLAFDDSSEELEIKSDSCFCDTISSNGFVPEVDSENNNYLCPEDSAQARKSYSLTDIRIEEAGACNRRNSLPDQLAQVTPLLAQRASLNRGITMTTCANSETETLLPSLYTEVWTWGRGQEGQLGHGDYLPRLQPLCIKSLSKKEVVKIAAGANHSLALTAHCQAFSWGSNKFGQLGHMTYPSTVPCLIKVSHGIRVWDMAAGQTHTLLLADGDCFQPVLYYSGEQIVEQTPGNPQTHSGTHTKMPVLLPFCISMGYVSSVFAGGVSCLALADQNVMGFISTLHELASAERKFYDRLTTVKDKIRPLLVRVSLGRTSTLLFQKVAGHFSRLCHLTGQNSVSLTTFVQQGRDVRTLVLVKETSIFLDTYKEYFCLLGNFLVMGGFQALVKPSQEVYGKKLEQLQDVLEVKEKNVSQSDVLANLFYLPLQHLHEYGKLLLRLSTCFDVHTEEYVMLQEACSKYDALAALLQKQKKEAESTHNFWRNFPGKNYNPLRKPGRRLLCESSNKALTLQNAGRFSLNWFILFNDTLVHAQFSSYHVYPLATLWVEPVSDESIGLSGLKLTTPEDSFTVLASSPLMKAKWIRAINQAVDEVLQVGLDAKVLGVNGSPRAEPPVSRTATHTFTKEGRLKDATYEGRWLTGKPHGRGTLKWPDGRVYCGAFRNGLEDGFGDYMIPNKTFNKCDRYQGHWKEGKMHGFGTFWYATGEVYEGLFQENQRHGYGMLNSSRLSSPSSSVFVGQWVLDKKTGYGVFDDISRGEKYMGMWLDDQRQGTGVVVTQYGLYYEGAFSANRMMGSGLLLSDDDAVLEGEFSEDWTLNGRGVLSMPNGDSLDGIFVGEWRTGLKVAGTFIKTNLYGMEKKETRVPALGSMAVSADEKWKAVFEEVWSRLGCDGPGRGDSEKAWENIAVTLTTSIRQKRDSMKHFSHSQNKILESLEFIPQHAGPITVETYENIRRYLLKACELPLHPLGWLLETLVTVYRMTYVGVGSNRRLLSQAVEEIRSYLRRIFQLVRFLFPCLPEEGEFIPDHKPDTTQRRLSCSLESSTQSDILQQGVVVSSSSLLLPVLLPCLYPPLFTLYTLEKEREDQVYWDCVKRLNKQPDLALLAFLGVQQKFWPVTISELGNSKQVLASTKDACFSTAVETLQQISTRFTPSDKLLVIQQTFEEMTQEVQTLLGQDFLWSMDDLFPLFLFVVLRSRIRNLGSEVSLIEDLMEPSLQHGEFGLMFTTLKACYFQIQQEKTT